MDPVVSACIYSSAQVSTAVELLPARVLVYPRVQCLHADTFMFHLDYAAIRTHKRPPQLQVCIKVRVRDVMRAVTHGTNTHLVANRRTLGRRCALTERVIFTGRRHPIGLRLIQVANGTLMGFSGLCKGDCTRGRTQQPDHNDTQQRALCLMMAGIR